MEKARRARVLQILVSLTLRGISLLLSVAVIVIALSFSPAFERYQEKARESERKIQAAALYGAEKSYYSEYSTYAASFEKIGFAPERNRQYAIGFPTACLKRWRVPLAEAYLPAQTKDAAVREREILDFFAKVRKLEDCKDISAGFEIFFVKASPQESPLEAWRLNSSTGLERIPASL